MNMKIKYVLSVLFLTLILSSCSTNDDPFQIEAEEYPRIMGRWPNKDDNGNWGIFEIPTNETLVISLQFTPSPYTTGIWYLNDIPVYEGSEFTFNGYEVGLEYKLKLVVSTDYHTTTREARIKVLPPVGNN